MIEPSKQLLLPAPDMNRWLFYRKRPAKPTRRHLYLINPYQSPLTIDETNIEKILDDMLKNFWKDILGPDPYQPQ